MQYIHPVHNKQITFITMMTSDTLISALEMTTEPNTT